MQAMHHMLKDSDWVLPFGMGLYLNAEANIHLKLRSYCLKILHDLRILEHQNSPDRVLEAMLDF